MVHHEILETPNQPAGKGVYTFYGSSEINAPAEQVWSVVRDFANYNKWNSCNPSVKTPSGTNDIRVGDMITLAWRVEPTGKLDDVPCKVLVVNDEEMQVTWRGCPHYVPFFLLLPEKVHRVTRLEGGKCLFEGYETQGRPLAYVIKWFLGEKLHAYAQRMAKELKNYVEGLQEAEQNGS